MRTLAIVFVVLIMVGFVFAQNQPVIFVDSKSEDFAIALAAGWTKKHVPATLTTHRNEAQYILIATLPEQTKDSTGTKALKCIFAGCAGIDATGSVNVQLTEVSTGKIIWAYRVVKARGKHHNIQSEAEAIAKHFKNEVLPKLTIK